MIGSFGRQGPAATLRQHCPQMTRRRCNSGICRNSLSVICVSLSSEVDVDQRLCGAAGAVHLHVVGGQGPDGGEGLQAKLISFFYIFTIVSVKPQSLPGRK